MKSFKEFYDEVDDLKYFLDECDAGYTEEQWKHKNEIDTARFNKASMTYDDLLKRYIDDEFEVSENEEEAEEQLYELEELFSNISRRIQIMCDSIMDEEELEEWEDFQEAAGFWDPDYE